MLLQLATMKFVARQVACGGGNTGNKALQLAKQQCCATSCKEMLPVLLDLNFFSLLPYFYFRTPIHDWKQCSQKLTTSNVMNSDVLTFIIEDERVYNTRDCDQCNQNLYAC